MFDIAPGTLGARVLDQATYWVTREATVLALSAMSRAHLVGVLALLDAQAVHLHMDASSRRSLM